MHGQWIAAAAVAAAMFGAPRAHAQDIDTSFAPGVPSINAAVTSPRRPVASADVAAPAAPVATARPLRNSEAFMILGGAALITGALIGDTAGTIIMVGGAAVGLYGLYLWLGRPRPESEGSIGVGYSYHFNR